MCQFIFPLLQVPNQPSNWLGYQVLTHRGSLASRAFSSASCAFSLSSKPALQLSTTIKVR